MSIPREVINRKTLASHVSIKLPSRINQNIFQSDPSNPIRHIAPLRPPCIEGQKGLFSGSLVGIPPANAPMIRWLVKSHWVRNYSLQCAMLPASLLCRFWFCVLYVAGKVGPSGRTKNKEKKDNSNHPQHKFFSPDTQGWGSYIFLGGPPLYPPKKYMSLTPCVSECKNSYHR